MCCAIGALLLALITAWRTGSRTLFAWLPGARTSIGFGAAAIALVAGSVIMVEHVSHYAARAQASGRAVFAEFISQPICGGRTAN
ncbi:hypothetical protein CU102_06510 [Phyllobacterium brassicacearum]|uniref:Uncharacterized protein n=1 Tax=Phyllobacterium brassicacearum TaxID=314235 RepID=A0A2P7BTW9_9HYPH|nr:hypothetical protein CU102_06510 [Phyllobacterium brassicacearum]